MPKLYTSKAIAEQIAVRLTKAKAQPYNVWAAGSQWQVGTKEDQSAFEFQEYVKDHVVAAHTELEPIIPTGDLHLAEKALPEFPMIGAYSIAADKIAANTIEIPKIKTFKSGDMDDKAQILCDALVHKFPFMTVDFDKNLSAQTYVFVACVSEQYASASLAYQAFAQISLKDLASELEHSFSEIIPLNNPVEAKFSKEHHVKPAYQLPAGSQIGDTMETPDGVVLTWTGLSWMSK